MMLWSPQQDHALCVVAKWLRARDRPVFRLFGYAGTGKTTLARHLAKGVSGRVLFAAYTGKAASVMRSKGCTGASTIHSLI
jgi:exodeoxyribonuclease-5